MLSQRVRNLISRECRGIMQILPFLGLAIICALIVGPVLVRRKCSLPPPLARRKLLLLRQQRLSP